MTWGEILAAVLTGGIIVKVLEIIYQEFSERKTRSRTAKEFVDDHLGPLLKSADELAGKLSSLLERDFKSILDVRVSYECLHNRDFGSLLYLFGTFWARIEVLRKEGVSVAMGKDPRGDKLQAFLDCLESRHIRLIDRISQRAMGEALLKGTDTVAYIEFVRQFEAGETEQWVNPLALFLARMKHTSERQRLLQYRVVINAMVDTLDPHHQLTHERPSRPEKLSERSRKELRFRAFGVYLKFLPNPQKYLGPLPKKRP